MDYPVKPVVMPKDIKDSENGKLATGVLAGIDNGHLHHLAADAWHAMKVAANADRIDLEPTSKWDLYRPYDRQEALFLARYTDKDNGSEVTRKWKGKTWYLKPGVAPAGVPGTSNHGWGLAVDVSGASGKRLQWLLKHADKFGFSWEVKNGANAEAWHIRYYVGDAVPQRVKDILATNPRKK